MADLQMTIGDFRQFLVTFTKAGAPIDLAGVQRIDFVLQTVAGVELARWGLSGPVVPQTPTSNGQAMLTVTPPMTAFATGFTQLNYTWDFIDAFGNPTHAADTGQFTLTPPP